MHQCRQVIVCILACMSASMPLWVCVHTFELVFVFCMILVIGYSGWQCSCVLADLLLLTEGGSGRKPTFAIRPRHQVDDQFCVYSCCLCGTAIMRCCCLRAFGYLPFYFCPLCSSFTPVLSQLFTSLTCFLHPSSNPSSLSF